MGVSRNPPGIEILESFAVLPLLNRSHVSKTSGTWHPRESRSSRISASVAGGLSACALAGAFSSNHRTILIHDDLTASA